MHSGVSVLKIPLERGATAVSLVSQSPISKAIDGSSQQSKTSYFAKRIIWARRLGLPTHRFVYLVVRDVGGISRWSQEAVVGDDTLSTLVTHTVTHSLT